MLEDYLSEVKGLILEEIQAMVPNNRYGPILYELMLRYPLRAAKGLRPALAIAACRALGGKLQDVLSSAAVLELYHNAFLIHDDIEDGSLARRGHPTLHREFGVPIAINVGDAMLALSLSPLLENMRTLGLGKALKVLQTVQRMALHSAEGQALELHWIRQGAFSLQDKDYARLVFKKTCWYTFIAPLLVGGIIAGANESQLILLRRFGGFLGVAFQIQDDVLNLVANEALYGKEIDGDLWEGKHTLILMHALRNLPKAPREHALKILQKPRPQKTAQEVQTLKRHVLEQGSLDYARAWSQRLSTKAGLLLERLELGPSTHQQFLNELVDYVTTRER